jgi:hypothetical protein
MNSQVNEYINTAPDEQKEIMNLVRSLIHESVINTVEEFKWSRPVFKAKKDFAYMQATKNHVTLGFMNFEKIIDAEKKLEGTGKDMRHIKIKKVSDINKAELAEWFKSVTKE